MENAWAQSAFSSIFFLSTHSTEWYCPHLGCVFPLHALTDMPTVIFFGVSRSCQIDGINHHIWSPNQVLSTFTSRWISIAIEALQVCD